MLLSTMTMILSMIMNDAVVLYYDVANLDSDDDGDDDETANSADMQETSIPI